MLIENTAVVELSDKADREKNKWARDCRIWAEHMWVSQPCRWRSVDVTRMSAKEQAGHKQHWRCGCHLGTTELELAAWDLS